MTHRSHPSSTLTVLNRGTIVTGDGATVIEDGALVMGGGSIRKVSTEPVDSDGGAYDEGSIVDVDGRIVLPGLINSHMHGAVRTPFTAAAAPPPSAESAEAARDRHLLEGCTTIVNTDAFALPSEHGDAVGVHPVKLEFGACPTPATKEAAVQSGGELTTQHRNLTLADVVESGAVLLGEVGSKNTLTGGIQRKEYVPELFDDRFGVELTPEQVGRLVEAALGRHAEPDHHDPAGLHATIDDLGLRHALEPDDCRELIVETVMPSVRSTRRGFEEVGDFAAAHGVPMLVHASAPTLEATQQLAERDLDLIVGHVNHPSLTAAESISLAEEVRADETVTVEASSWDLFGHRTRDDVPIADLRERFLDLVSRDLVDIVSTDYAGGYWHGLLVTLDAIVDRGIRSLREAIALVTGNVATAIPSIGATRGTLERGNAADVLVVDDDDITDIERVFIDGERVVRNGARCECGP